MIKAGSKSITSKNSKSCNHPSHPIQHVQDDESNKVVDISEDQWPNVAWLNFGGLSQQGHVIQEFCWDAIRIIEVTLVTQHAWPELYEGTIYKCWVLLEAIKTLQANNEDKRWDADYKTLHKQISEDEKFSRTIGKFSFHSLRHFNK